MRPSSGQMGASRRGGSEQKEATIWDKNASVRSVSRNGTIVTADGQEASDGYDGGDNKVNDNRNNNRPPEKSQHSASRKQKQANCATARASNRNHNVIYEVPCAVLAQIISHYRLVAVFFRPPSWCSARNRRQTPPNAAKRLAKRKNTSIRASDARVSDGKIVWRPNEMPSK